VSATSEIDQSETSNGRPLTAPTEPRIMLSMQDTCGCRLSREDWQRHSAWNNTDPPDASEIERDKRVTRVHGKTNEYVSSNRRR
jgi:endonuclease I